MPPKKKGKSKKPVAPKVAIPAIKRDDPEELRIFVAEAEQVNLLTVHPGWEILRRDIDSYRQEILRKLVYLNPKTIEYENARVLYIASDKLIQMIEDYSANRKRALELLEKIDNPDTNIILDVDN